MATPLQKALGQLHTRDGVASVCVGEVPLAARCALGSVTVPETVGTGTNGLPGTKSRAAADRRNPVWIAAPGEKPAAAADMGCTRAATTLP